MKITEIRNNLFGLSDLKGLIQENTFEEGLGRAGFNWKSFFLDDPDIRLKMDYKDFVSMCSTKEGIAILEKYGFDGTIPAYKSFVNAQKRISKAVGDNNSLNDAIGFFDLFFDQNANGITSDVLYAYDELQNIFRNNQIAPEEKSNYKEKLETTEKGVRAYFSEIARLATSSIAEANKEGVNIPVIKPSLFGDTTNALGKMVPFVYNPKSLYFFFINVCIGAGKGFHIKNYLDRIPNYSEYIKSFYNTVKANAKTLNFSEDSIVQDVTVNDFQEQLQNDIAQGKRYPELIQNYFLKPLGIDYGTYISNCSDVLYNAYFYGKNINKISDVINKVKQERGSLNIAMGDGLGPKGEYANTAGGLMYSSLAFLASYRFDIRNLVEQTFNYMRGNEFARFRNSLYRKKYEDITGNVFDDKFLNTVSECFNIPVDLLFDPLIDLRLNSVNEGFREWFKKNNKLNNLLKVPLYTTYNVSEPNSGYISAIERIFLSAYALQRRLEASYKKYGKGPESQKMTINILLSEAGKGLATFKKWNPTSVVPAPQGKLNVMYKEIKESLADENGVATDSIAFWQLLELHNQIKDKTQTDIYYFLIDHSKNDVKWTYEYNRNEKVDDDLGQKSIDILAEIPGHHFCFEYQGEQHYRLLQVKLEDDKQFPMFLAMKFYILYKCGFILEKIGKNYYVTGLNNEVWENQKNNVKNIIIDTYINFLKRITDDKFMLSKRFDIDNFVKQLYSTEKNRMSYELDEALAGHTVNRNFKYFSESQKQYIDYFNSIISKGANDDTVFEEPALDQQIPYIGSPIRFMDEIDTAVNMARDWEKRMVLKNKMNDAWDVIYITPKKSLTKDDLKYTQMLAGDDNNSAVFKWEGPKMKNEALVNYMVSNGIGLEKTKDDNSYDDKKTTINENNTYSTLFEMAVKEAVIERNNMLYDKTMIYSFMQKYTDFTDSDIESGYKNVYRPGWHVRPLQFWINPPYNDDGISIPSLTGTIILLNDGKIMVESMSDNLFYDLDQCLGNSFDEFIFAIQNQD